ncbi:2952_t:CDS:2 [Paraglomus brasilianum]|uniref:2952_t:CDS:1 n=1 Tax=Paraglomus brasilianum TaxID=144538 RepID=A0A9N8WFR6_9GLOM|nr:2952_t:CDS:2 [Paraglomus brasilianum]
MSSYFDEKGLADPDRQERRTRPSEDNPDVSVFFGSSPRQSQAGSSRELPELIDQIYALAGRFGMLRDLVTGSDSQQTFLNNLITQLLEEAGDSSKGPPPASKAFIESLPDVPKAQITPDDSCIVCAENFSESNKSVTRLPSQHMSQLPT